MAFGINLSKIPGPDSTQADDFKGESSRETREILSSKCYLEDISIREAILKDAEEAEKKIGHNSKGSGYSELVLLEVIAGLKARQKEGISLFEEMVLGVMRALDPFNMERFYRGAKCLTEMSQYFPKGFPANLRQRAEAILIGKLKDVIGPRETLDFLIERFFRKEIGKIEEDIFLARRQKVDAIYFASLMFELRRLATAPPVKGRDFRKVLIEGMKGASLTLVHIKCLRYVYPRSGGVCLLTDTNDIEIEGVGGKYSPRREKNLSPQLLNLRDLLEKKGIKRTRLVVLVADNDFDSLFPSGSPFVKEEQRQKAKKDSLAYLEFLRREYGRFMEIKFLTQYLEEKGLEKKYQSRREEVLRDIRTMQGKIVDPSFFEINRVNSHYEHYRQRLGDAYSRDEARRSAAEQLASTVALEVVFSHLSGLVMAIQENEGGENNYIGAGKFPIFFTKLREPASFG